MVEMARKMEAGQDAMLEPGVTMTPAPAIQPKELMAVLHKQAVRIQLRAGRSTTVPRLLEEVGPTVVGMTRARLGALMMAA